MQLLKVYNVDLYSVGIGFYDLSGFEDWCLYFYLFWYHLSPSLVFLMSSVHRWLYAFLLAYKERDCVIDSKAKGSGFIFNGMSLVRRCLSKISSGSLVLNAVTLPLQGKKGFRQPMIDDESEGGRNNDTAAYHVKITFKVS